MSQNTAEPHSLIADIRRSMAATAEDPPSAGLKLMMSAEDIAAIMGDGRTADTVRNKHQSWTRANGFPAPIPGMAPLVWSGPQFMAWLRGPVTIVEGSAKEGMNVLQSAGSVLQRKYGSAA